MPTEAPIKEPEVAPAPPKTEPLRRLQPDTLCPGQTETIIEIVRRHTGK